MTPNEDLDLVLRQSPYRIVVFVAVQLIWIVSLLSSNRLFMLGPEWLHTIINAIRGTLVVVFGYLGITATI